MRPDAERAVEYAVREYLEARGAFRPCAALCASYLSTVQQRRDAMLPRLGLRDGRCTVDAIDVTHVGDGVAVADVAAILEGFADTPLGPPRDAERFHGPWLLHHVDGTWKITAYTVARRSTLDSVHVEPEGRKEAADVVVEPLQVNLRGDVTIVTLAVENRRDETVDLRTITVWGELRLGRGTIEDGVAVGPGERVVAQGAVNPRFPLRTKGLRLKVGAKVAGRGRMRLGPMDVVLGRSGRRILQDEGLEVPVRV